MATPLRNVRIADDVWDAAMVKAASEGTSLSDVIRTWLEAYVLLPDDEFRVNCPGCDAGFSVWTNDMVQAALAAIAEAKTADPVG